MADAEAVLAGLRSLDNVSLSGLVLNERGFDRALACETLHEICFVAVASESFSQRNQGASIADNVRAWQQIAPRAAAAGLLRSVTIAVAFGCPFEDVVPAERVMDLALMLAEAGLEELSLADTIGVAAPAEVEDYFGRLGQVLPGVTLRAHFHNTRNMGYANADAALRSGVKVLDASVAGLGGCPFAPGATGNIATEDLVYMLDRQGVSHGIDGMRVAAAASWMETVMGRRLPGHAAHVPSAHRRIGGIPK